jgi:hypothetical protein
MTVCIGARDHGDNIIMVSDHKVGMFGGQLTADDTALKWLFTDFSTVRCQLGSKAGNRCLTG